VAINNSSDVHSVPSHSGRSATDGACREPHRLESRRGAFAEPTIGEHSYRGTRAITEAGHARAYEETEAWLLPLLRRVPITRVVNATPLDSIGLPVWSAVTPMARDLTVHAGKGPHGRAARLSAIMEAIERMSAEQVSRGRTVRGTFAEMRGLAGFEALDPARFDLPYETRYHRERTISWCLAYDLLEKRHFWVALDLLISPSEEGVCVGVETNGLASGNSVTEATLHAIYEVIERDAVSLAQFCDRYGEPRDRYLVPICMINPGTLPEAAQAWRRVLLSRELELNVRDLTNEIGVPVYQATIVDEHFPSHEGEPLQFDGYGADLDPAKATMRAVTEAVQSHTIVALGARDTFEGTRPIPDRAARLLRQLEIAYPEATISFPEGAGGASGDLKTDLERVVLRLRGAGFDHCLVGDLTRPDLGVPVVRVLVPGLAPPYGSSSRRPGIRLLQRIV